MAHYRAANDAECLAPDPGIHRRGFRALDGVAPSGSAAASAGPPARRDLYDILPQDHRLSYDMRQVLACLLDGGALDEFQPDVAREMLCGHAHIEGRPVAVIANQRGVIKGQPGERPRFGGIVYTEQRGEGRLLHRDREPRAPAAPLRAGRERVHGRPRGRAVGDHPRRRALRRGDGDRGRAQDRAHGQPRLRRGLLRHGGAGLRSRLHPLLAHRPHGRDGGRVRGHGGARPRDRAGPAGEARARRPRSRPSIELDARRLRARSSTPATPRRAGTWTPSSRPEETRDQLAFAAPDRAPTTPGRISVPSCSRRSTRRTAR